MKSVPASEIGAEIGASLRIRHLAGSADPTPKLGTPKLGTPKLDTPKSDAGTGAEFTGTEFTRRSSESAPAIRWTLQTLSGRLSELSGVGPTAQLSLAFSMLVDAQQQGEPAAWITTSTSTFFPPDAAADGVDLTALPVIFVPDAPSAARAAEHLARSGAFGLLVLDLVDLTSFESPHNRPVQANPSRTGFAPLHNPTRACHRGAFRRSRISAALQSRLTGLARHHDMAVLCLTSKQPEAASLGALVSLRCQALREEEGQRFSCRLEVLKDKRHGPGWQHREWFDGPGGLR